MTWRSPGKTSFQPPSSEAPSEDLSSKTVISLQTVNTAEMARYVIVGVLVDFNLLIIRRGVLLLLLRAAVTDVVRALLSISVTSTSHSRCAKTSGWIWFGED